MRRGVRKLIVTLLFCSVAFSLSAQFSGTGTGTEDDPYRIYNMDQLNQVRNFDDGEYFSLETDLDMADWIAENNPVEGWQPINAQVNFDGNGHTISNMWINRPNTNNVGLFGSFGGFITNLHLINVEISGGNNVGGIIGYISSYYTIKNCSVQGTITGNDNVGGIIGLINCDFQSRDDAIADIAECYFKGLIIGNSAIGGIIGAARIDTTYWFVVNAYISNCKTDCIIKASAQIGGIAGCLEGGEAPYIAIVVNRCYSLCTIEGGSSGPIGGIVGRSRYVPKTSITKCYSHIVALDGKSRVGGIIGNVSSEKLSVNDNYSTGIIQTTGDAYGIYNGGSDHCYAQFHTISGSIVQGLGANASGCVAINDRLVGTSAVSRVGNGSNNLAWTLTTMILDGKKQPLPVDSPENGTNTGLSTLKLQATYEGIGWDFANTWKINETESFPYFQWQTAPPYFVQTLKKGDTRLAGQCTEAGIVTVRIGDRRYEVQSNGNNWSLDLDEPLEAADVVEMWVQAEGKAPSYVVCTSPGLTGSGTETDPYLIETVGDLQAISDLADEECYYKLTADIDLTDYIAANGWMPVVLSGSFDGQGHTISGLQCNTTSLAGLFHTLVAGCEIKDLKVIVAEGAKVQGSAETGGIVARNYGTITNCSVEGNVQGSNQAGGIAGINEGMITGCKKSGTVSGGSATGGIAGQNKGTVEQCYTDGFVEASTAGAKVGGIVGWNTEGKVNDCYSSAEITASGSNAYGAGIVGYNEGTVEYCYSDGNVSGYSVAGICGYNSGANAYLRGCVAANSTLSGLARALRVLGGFASGASSPSVADNYAVKSMVVSVNNVPQIIYDDPVNGTAKTSSELMQKATYVALGWNFTNAWKIDEGFSYPYLSAFDIPVSGITLDKTEAELTRGEILQLAATVVPEDARNQRVKWTSSDEKIATVDANGKVAAVGVGEATITATAADGSGATATCKVTIKAILAKSITLNKEEVSIRRTDTFQLTATVLPETADNRVVTWTSSDEKVATIDTDGKVTAVGVGEATITATATDGSEVSATCKVTVTPILTESISLNKKELTIEKTDSVQLVATVLPETADDRTVTWTSSDEEIVAVSADGWVKALKAGAATVTATANDSSKKMATCAVKVTPKLAEEISLNKTELALERTETAQLTAIVSPETVDDRTVTWHIDDEKVATVNSEGLVTAVGVGKTTITATTNDGTKLSASCTVTVSPKLVESISLSENKLTLTRTRTYQLYATVRPEEAANRTVAWESENPEIATVDATGLVTGVANGETTIYARTTDGSMLSASCKVEVTPIYVERIVLEFQEYTKKKGEKSGMEYHVYPEDADDKSVSITVENPNIVSARLSNLDNWFNYDCLEVGESLITLTANDGSGVSASVRLIVEPYYVTFIRLDQTELTLERTEKFQLTGICMPPEANNRKLMWRSADISIADVDAETGWVTGVGVGTVDITAYADDGSGVFEICKVTVIPKKVESVSLNESKLTLKRTRTYQLQATVLPEVADDRGVTWSSDNPMVAKVDDNGLVTALAVGEANITATAADGSGNSATCNVSVAPNLVESLSLKDTSISLERGTSRQLTAIVEPQDADDISLTWSSNNADVATVDATGRVSAIGIGEAVITATTNDGSGLSATCHIGVVPKGVRYLNLNTYEMTMKVNESALLEVEVVPDDAEYSHIVWTSSDERVAVVDDNGLVTARGVGQAEITVTAYNFDGSGTGTHCDVTVVPTMVESIALNMSDLELKLDDTYQLEATVSPVDATNKSVAWTSSDESVATVDNNGLVTAVGFGDVYITAAANDGSGVAANCYVRVVPTMVESIALNMSDLELKLDDTYQLEATVSPVDATNKSVAWTSSDENVATVDNNGLVTAVGIGDVDITAAANDGSGVAANCHVTVEPIMATSIKLNEETLLMKKGETSHLEVTVLPHNATDKSVTWTSSDEYVVAVDDGGNIVAVGDGEAEVVATTNDGSNLSASCQVTVIDPEGGVYGVSADGISVFVKDDRIYVTGKEDDDVVTVHTLEGRLVYRGTDNAVNVYSNIYYLVTVRTETYKVFVP